MEFQPSLSAHINCISVSGSVPVVPIVAHPMQAAGVSGSTSTAACTNSAAAFAEPSTAAGFTQTRSALLSQPCCSEQNEPGVQDFPPEDVSLGDVKGDSAAGDREEGAWSVTV